MGVQEIAQFDAFKQLYVLYNETYDISSLFAVDKLRVIILLHSCIRICFTVGMAFV